MSRLPSPRYCIRREMRLFEDVLIEVKRTCTNAGPWTQSVFHVYSLNWVRCAASVSRTNLEKEARPAITLRGHAKFSLWDLTKPLSEIFRVSEVNTYPIT